MRSRAGAGRQRDSITDRWQLRGTVSELGEIKMPTLTLRNISHRANRRPGSVALSVWKRLARERYRVLEAALNAVEHAAEAAGRVSQKREAVEPEHDLASPHRTRDDAASRRCRKSIAERWGRMTMRDQMEKAMSTLLWRLGSGVGRSSLSSLS